MTATEYGKFCRTPGVFFLAVGDIIQRGELFYRVDHIDTVNVGPDAGKRDVLSVIPVHSIVKAVRVWEPLPGA